MTESDDHKARADVTDATDDLVAAIEHARAELGRRRYQGQDPEVRGPAGKQAAAILARILAADRESALVRLPDGAVNPSEDRADAELGTAINAMRTWQFDIARRSLDMAARLSRIPARQQRISLIRAMGQVASTVVFRDPDERHFSKAIDALNGLMPKLDALAPEEIAHYRAESARLYDLWDSAKRDPAIYRHWALLRATLAQRTGARESALAWILRCWDREYPDAPSADPGLTTMIAAIRLVFAQLADPALEIAEDAVPQPFPTERAADALTVVTKAVFAHDHPGATSDALTRHPFSLVPFLDQPRRSGRGS